MRNISLINDQTLTGEWVGNKIDDHSDIVVAPPVVAASTTSSFSTYHPASMDWEKTAARRDEKYLRAGIGCDLY